MVRVGILLTLMTGILTTIQAQSFNWVSSKDGKFWKQNSEKVQNRAVGKTDVVVKGTEKLSTFKAFGTCFNELGWDALNMLSSTQQELVMKQLFAPDGEMHFSVGRIPMNANDYARSWYSCDEVDGDFQLKYFNVDRDKQTLIPYIKFAQKYNPDITFWISPWSPPTWMKINHHYACKTGKFNDLPEDRQVNLFTDDQFIQDPRYLQAYADYFCKFVKAYRQEGISITSVMYQNEAYARTEYPGCAWTADGTARFIADYLVPTLTKEVPGVDAYLGTLNTNRMDVVGKILSNDKLAKSIKGVTFQWEGGQILPKIRAQYPDYSYIQSESECGWGEIDWKAAEHIFDLINHYLANGCEKYVFWNSILADKGMSTWGWSQNSLIRVNSQTKAVTYTPEYYAAEHYSHFIPAGSVVLGYKESGTDKKPILVMMTPEKKYVVIAGNLADKKQIMSVKLGPHYLNADLDAHSFHTFVMK